MDIGVASDTWAGAPDGRMAQMFQEAGIKSIEWNLEETPYPLPDDSFDVVVMTEVYEHLRDYPVRSLEEVRRILRPGGRLYFTTPNAAYLMNRLRLLKGQSTATPLADWIGGLPHARHAREYTFAEVDSLLRYARLRSVARYGREFHLASGIKGQAKKAVNLLARVRPELGPFIVYVAECTPLPYGESTSRLP